MMRLVRCCAALALMAPAATFAAEDRPSMWIRIQQLPTGGSMAAAPASSTGWIEIQGWDWEVEPADKVDGLTVKQRVKPATVTPRFVTFFDPTNPDAAAAGSEKWMKDRNHQPGAKPGGVRVSSGDVNSSPAAGGPRRGIGTSDLTMKRGTSPAPAPPARPSRPDGFLDYDEGDTGTHEAREPDPLPSYLWGFKVNPTTASPTPADPPKQGRIKVKFAWDACSRGARLPSVELRDARALYRLEDVTVVGCAADGATFRYARLRRSPAS